jgi:hypothetical protein
MKLSNVLTLLGVGIALAVFEYGGDKVTAFFAPLLKSTPRYKNAETTLYDAQNNLDAQGNSIVIPYTDYLPNVQFGEAPLQTVALPGFPLNG